MKLTRDYDKEPIIIKDYGELFQWIFPVFIIWFIFFYSEIYKILSGDFSRVFSNDILVIIKVDIVMPVSLILMIVFYYLDIRKIYSGESYFEFNNKNILYQGYGYE